MTKEKVIKWIIFSIALAINLFIIGNACMVGETSTAESAPIANSIAGVINNISPGTINSNNFESFAKIIRKIFGHFAVFGLSGVFTTWSVYLFSKDSKLRYFFYFSSFSLLIGFAVAWISEFIQIFVPGRFGAVTDVLIDVFGYFIGVLLVILVFLITKKPIFKKEKTEEKVS